MNFIKASDIIDSFNKSEMGLSDSGYLEFHKYRYLYLLEIIQGIILKCSNKEQLRLLDAGPAFQTLLIRKYFPQIIVDTVGYDHSLNHLTETEIHYTQDFNYTDKIWSVDENKYDIIVFCEVIEHLYSKPEIIVDRLYKSLKKGGYLIVQTPNAAAIHKRINLLFGKNPYQLLLDNKMGHFREYTANELRIIMENAGLKSSRLMFKNYFNYNRTIIHKLFLKLEKIIPKSFRDGITLIAQKS
jgi:trans-aconitate methyltransferase